MNRAIERLMWRQRTTRMDSVFMALERAGCCTATELAAQLKMQQQDVQELLEDLQVDAVVGNFNGLYYVDRSDHGLH